MQKLSFILQKYVFGNKGTAFGIVFITLSIIFSFTGCDKFKKDIYIPRTTIQEAIVKKFPYDKSAIIARTTLKDPDIYFQDSSVGIRLNYWANFLEKEVNGKLDLNASIRYEKGKFYLQDLYIVEFSMEEKEFSSKGKLLKIIKNMLKNYIDVYPVYTLNQYDFKHNLAKLLLKDIKVQGDSLCVTIGL